MNRRHFLTGLTTLLAAPAIVRVSAIMPVKALPVAEAPLTAWEFFSGVPVYYDYPHRLEYRPHA